MWPSGMASGDTAGLTWGSMQTPPPTTAQGLKSPVSVCVLAHAEGSLGRQVSGAGWP